MILLGPRFPYPPVSGSASWTRPRRESHINPSVRPIAPYPKYRLLCLHPFIVFPDRLSRLIVNSMAHSMTVIRKRGKNLFTFALLVADPMLFPRRVRQMSTSSCFHCPLTLAVQSLTAFRSSQGTYARVDVGSCLFIPAL